ncbi:hypothetical protein M0R45_002259 [Rubus argutus]|uniref:Transposase MuDR plant domain-containing protein n=1 Tax=Rubus argutus TaxID=59490 RepID=A0AAW1VJJ9_RUBAR
MKNPHFELGQQFDNVAQFREAVRHYSVLNKQNLYFQVNNRFKVTVVCGKKQKGTVHDSTGQPPAISSLYTHQWASKDRTTLQPLTGVQSTPKLINHHSGNPDQSSEAAAPTQIKPSRGLDSLKPVTHSSHEPRLAEPPPIAEPVLLAGLHHRRLFRSHHPQSRQ